MSKIKLTIPPRVIDSPKGWKIYAELTVKKNRKNQGIKSLWGNKMEMEFADETGSIDNKCAA